MENSKQYLRSKAHTTRPQTQESQRGVPLLSLHRLGFASLLPWGTASVQTSVTEQVSQAELRADTLEQMVPDIFVNTEV